jgi:hypothetical protein
MSNEYYNSTDVHTYVHNGKYYSLYKGYIGHPGIGHIEGLLTGDNPVSITAGSNYEESALGQGINEATGAVAGATGQAVGAALGRGAGGILGKTIGGAVHQEIGKQSMSSTIAKFSGSNKISFRLELIFFKEFLPPGQTYRNIIDKSYKLVLPSEADVGTSGAMPLTPPLKFSPGDLGSLPDYKSAITTKNSCSLLIGEKIEITHMICTSFTHTESVQRLSDSTPVYIRGNYEFMSGRVMLAEEVARWFNY